MENLNKPEEYYLGLVKTPPKKAQILTLLQKAKFDLANIANIQDAISVKNFTKAFEDLTKQIEVSEEIRLEAIEVRIRAERALGLAILKAQGSSKNNKTVSFQKLGIKQDEAYRCRKLSRISEQKFEIALNNIKLEVGIGQRKTLTYNSIITEAAQLDNGQSENSYSSLIKPSDNWNFSQVRYNRIDDKDSKENSWGYIPGEIYANCFWYYVKPEDLVVAPMAGSGQIWRVYQTRQEWMGKHVYEFDLKMFDLSPRGIYKDFIGANDLTKNFPVESADYIIMDIPYYGMVAKQYSDKPEDLANMTWENWEIALEVIAKNCAVAQKTGKLCTVISPNYRDITKGLIVMVTDKIRYIWESAGYVLHDKTYSSRRIQQHQNPNMARINNHAKANRIMLTDITEIMTFRKI